MADPLAKAGASAPPVIGAGCTQRYDPAHLGPELGTDFPGAQALWARYAAAGEQPIVDAAAQLLDDD
ncbi:hypothetical protein [Stutzerimonas stutzeri]|uniref:hypothetical protein n=1 Tax=Stutzerimonas stutzeri TaxID=316 RepID=UPI001C2E98C8|nr:hypothetical protein [Stutzerimonas stutzeri]